MAWGAAVLANAGAGIREVRNLVVQKCCGALSARVDRGR